MKFSLNLSDTCGVYLLHFPDRSVYVGSSINIARRWREHQDDLTASRHANYRVSDRYLRYGMPRMTIYQHTAPEDRWTVEQQVIDWYALHQPTRLLNIERVVRLPDGRPIRSGHSARRHAGMIDYLKHVLLG